MCDLDNKTTLQVYRNNAGIAEEGIYRYACGFVIHFHLF